MARCDVESDEIGGGLDTSVEHPLCVCGRRALWLGMGVYAAHCREHASVAEWSAYQKAEERCRGALPLEAC